MLCPGKWYALPYLLCREDWELEVQKDDKLHALKQDLVVDPKAHANYELKKGRL